MLVLPQYERDCLKTYLIENSPGPNMGTLTPETRIAMLCDIAKGLEYLMGRDIVMRDLGVRWLGLDSVPVIGALACPPPAATTARCVGAFRLPFF